MVATGLIYWVTKKPEGHTHWVERVNLGVFIGLPIAIAAYFWANRLLPAEWVNRAHWEAHTLFIIWFLALLHPVIFHKWSSTKLWQQQLTAACLTFALIPVIDALTTNIHLGEVIRHGDQVLTGFNLTLLITAAIFGYGAYKAKARDTVKAQSNIDREQENFPNTHQESHL